MASETGILGGATFLIFVMLLVARTGMVAMCPSDKELRSAGKALLLVMIALICDFMVEPDAVTVVSWLYLGLAAGVINQHWTGENAKV
jgi:hypothetical protein